jgi:hypothetical protein
MVSSHPTFSFQGLGKPTDLSPESRGDLDLTAQVHSGNEVPQLQLSTRRIVLARYPVRTFSILYLTYMLNYHDSLSNRREIIPKKPERSPQTVASMSLGMRKDCDSPPWRGQTCRMLSLNPGRSGVWQA